MRQARSRSSWQRWGWHCAEEGSGDASPAAPRSWVAQCCRGARGAGDGAGGAAEVVFRSGGAFHATPLFSWALKGISGGAMLLGVPRDRGGSAADVTPLSRAVAALSARLFSWGCGVVIGI